MKKKDILFAPVYDPSKPKINSTVHKPWKNPGGPAPATARDFRKNRKSPDYLTPGSSGSLGLMIPLR